MSDKTAFVDLLDRFTQTYDSGGVHTPPEMRLLMAALIVALRGKEVLETGYDAGATTEALAMTGAHVVAVDSRLEYAGASDVEAPKRLAGYDNVELRNAEALGTLKAHANGSLDFVFIDDGHSEEHVKQEMVEVRRVLRPGGIAAFHDTIYVFHVKDDKESQDGSERTRTFQFKDSIPTHFHGWEWITLPAISPKANMDFGLTLVRKPTT